MTRLEENIGKTVGALLLLGVGWIGTLITTNNQITMSNQLSLAEQKVLTLEIQKDITEMRIELTDSQDRIGSLEARVSKNESSISYLGKEAGL